MSELDDKVAHLRQDMSLYRRQLENKRGDDEVSVWWLLMRAKCASTSVLTIREWTILISYSQYWTGSSLQLRLMWGVFSNANEIYFFLMIFLGTSLHCKLVVPVQYRECKFGLRSCFRRWLAKKTIPILISNRCGIPLHLRTSLTYNMAVMPLGVKSNIACNCNVPVCLCPRRVLAQRPKPEEAP